MTKVLFKLLSDCEAEFFEAHYERILAKQVSLNEVVKTSSTVSEKQSSKVNIAKEANSASFDDFCFIHDSSDDLHV